MFVLGRPLQPSLMFVGKAANKSIEWHHVENAILTIVLLNVIMLSVITLSVMAPICDLHSLILKPIKNSIRNLFSQNKFYPSRTE